MITEILIGINILMFIIQLLLPGFTNLMMFDPSQPFELWRYFTSMFVHGGMFHILLNMYALFIFGKPVEKKTNLLLIYLLSGLAGNVLYIMLAQTGFIPMIPALGASGAVYGILGAFVVLYPSARLYSLYFPFGLSGKWAAIVFALFEFITMFSNDGIGHAAHLGGLVVGYIIAKLISKNEMQTYPQQWRVYSWEQINK